MGSERAFRDRNFSYRFTKLGDTAEKEFERWAVRHNVSYERFGFKRPDLHSFTRMSSFIRYSPDYIAEYRDVRPIEAAFFEVKGCGKDGTVKIKQETLEALERWQYQSALPCKFFIYDSHLQRVSDWLSVGWVISMVDDLEQGRFSENQKVYYQIPIDQIEYWERLALVG